jgi:carbamoyltransferase
VHPDRLGAAVAELLERGAVVGWATGRAEIGERALGGRSLLADPRRRESLVRLNRIKGREMWRPVAPSVQAEHLEDVFATPVGDPANFMLAAGFLRGTARRAMPAVTHVDGSARPQRVNRSTNPAYWSVIDEFRRRTGVPAVVNTSFNLAGEPMVRTAQDAVETYTRAADIDYLVLGRTVVARSRDALARWSEEIATGAA